MQPTLFEGAPGGGSIYDSLSLGVPSTISHISVNLEIDKEKNVIFFKAGSSDDMALKMKHILEKNIKRQSKDELIKEGLNRASKMGDSLLEAIEFILKSYFK